MFIYFDDELLIDFPIEQESQEVSFLKNLIQINRERYTTDDATKIQTNIS